jgi:hypothetical protein
MRLLGRIRYQSREMGTGVRATRATKFRRRAAALITTISACVLAAGCGSGTPKRTTGSPSGTAQDLAFSKCMRAHGVSGFPDPGTNISGPYDSIGGIAIPSTIDIQSPAFRAGMSACKGLVTALSAHGRPPITAGMKASMLAHAQCMRTHGVPGFQDPTFPAGGGIAVTDAGTNPDSPVYKHATDVCGNP